MTCTWQYSKIATDSDVFENHFTMLIMGKGNSVRRGIGDLGTGTLLNINTWAKEPRFQAVEVNEVENPGDKHRCIAEVDLFIRVKSMCVEKLNSGCCWNIRTCGQRDYQLLDAS